jgi:hypothetical protein
MATIEAFRHGDEVCIKAPGRPIMTVLAVEGLKVRCRDRENSQYWFDSIMLERYEHLRQHPVCESVNGNGLELSDDLECRTRNTKPSKTRRSRIGRSNCRQIFGFMPNNCDVRR